MKNRLKLTFNNLFYNKKTNIITILCLVFCSMFMLFPAGAMHSSTIIENTSEYIANVAENHTKSGKYLGLLIEPSKDDKKVNNPYYEFHSLYAIFREGMATYAGVANADRTHSVTITDIGDGINYSFLSVDTGFGVKEYYRNDEGEMVYKQEFYPLELMFYSNHPMIIGSYSFIYISQSKADALLDKNGLEHTRINYQSLLNTLVNVNIDGVEYKFAIDNIYLEHNYFYEALHEVIGDFILGGQKYPNNIKRQGLFFLRNYFFQNKYFIEYATTLYSASDFSFSLLERNLVDNYNIDYSKVVFTINNKNVISTIFLIFSILLLLVSLCLICFGIYEFNIYHHLLTGGVLLGPYFIFWFIHLISKNAIWFSSFAVSSELWVALAFIIIYLFLLFYKKGKQPNN